MMHDGTEHACHRDESWHDSISNNRPPSDFLPSFFDSTHYTGNTMASSAVHTQLRADFRLGRSSVLSAGCCNTDTLNTPDD